MNNLNPLSSFDISKEPLLDLLQSIKIGKIQLPEFQRDWLWEQERICRLLASVSLGFPVGSMMFWEQENSSFHLKPRLVEGVELTNPPLPKFLILDGQQRLTSLFMALFSGKPVVINRGPRYKPAYKWFYFDIKKALNLSEPERIDSILSVNVDKKLRRSLDSSVDCSCPQLEYQNNLFPVAQVFNFSQWRALYSKYWVYSPENLNLIDKFESQIIKKFEHYQIGLYILRSQLPKSAVSQIFVDNNKQLCELSHFDLLTSEYSSENFNLRADWFNREKRFAHQKILRLLKPTDFLQSLSLISSYHIRQESFAQGTNPDKLPKITCNGNDILEINKCEYQKWADIMSESFERVAKFLHSQAIYDADDLPYGMQLVVMAPLFVILGESAFKDVVRSKLEQWFYCGASSGIYSRSRDSAAAKDLIEVPNWLLKGGELPTTVIQAHITEERLKSSLNSQGAIYRVIAALLRKNGALDFLSGEKITYSKYFDEKIENHHIFPQSWCISKGFSRNIYNSIVNKTPLNWQTNRFLRGCAPSEYLAQLEQEGMSRQKVNEILRSHLIEPDFLRKDDFQGFFKTRTKDLLYIFNRSMGKV